MIIATITQAHEKPFPKIMRGTETGVIIMFSAYKTGTVIVAGSSGHRIGDYSENWFMDGLEDYNEPVTLQNV